jgi:hypothetical protein
MPNQQNVLRGTIEEKTIILNLLEGKENNGKIK